MQTSTIVGAALILAAVALAVFAPRIARLPILKITMLWRFDRRSLSQFGQRLIAIHLEVNAALIATWGVGALPVSDRVRFVDSWMSVGFLAFNFLLLTVLTTPAIISGKATINPPKKSKGS